MPDTELIDGWYYDAETGELLGAEVPKNDFAITDQASAEWVLSALQAAEADLAAIDHTPGMIQARAIMANAERIRKDRQRRVDWLRQRFGAELAEFARTQLDGKRRTWPSIYGSVSFRKKPGGVRVANADEAARIAWRFGWDDAIKVTREFQISKLTPEQLSVISGSLSNVDEVSADVAKAFRIEPESEAVVISTEVGK